MKNPRGRVLPGIFPRFNPKKKTMNNLPYIDLGCDAATLRKYALENFGKKISATAKDETVRVRFREIYKEETGIELQDVDPLDDHEDDEPEEGERQKEEKPQPTHVTINVQDDERDPHPICGSVNFVSYRIERNKDVKVPWHIYQSLLIAKRTVVDPDTKVSKEVPMYPFSVVDFHFE